MPTEMSALVVAVAIVALPTLYLLLAFVVLRALAEIAPGRGGGAAAAHSDRPPRRDLPRAA
jgi:hypothetical protein